MAEPLEVQGMGASSGIALGPVYLVDGIEAPFVPRTETMREHENLAKAIAVAIDALESLGRQSGPESVAILDFQIEVLCDPEILEETARRIDTGDSAAFAWVSTLDGYIEDLERADDEHVRARSADIVDIKNRVLRALAGKPIADFPAGSIFVGKDLEPSRFLSHDWSRGGGIVLFSGSIASHVAMLARARSVPMVIAAGHFSASVGDHILVDGNTGTITLHPEAEDLRPTRHSSNFPATEAGVPPESSEARTADGIAIRLSINLNGLDELASIDPGLIDGVGLMRSEFAVASLADAANEEGQLEIYRRVLEWAGGKPVAIRMLDLGGDKQVPGLIGISRDSLTGLRGIRLLLARPEMARVQVRALLRSAVYGNLSVLLPMVTMPSEVEDMKEIFREEARHLERRGIAHRVPPIGIMVEVPAAALMLDTFGAADFFSFGTNDMAQYLTAAARYDPAVAFHHAQATPAMLRLLTSAVGLAGAINKPASICGEMAGNPQCLPGLLAAGFRHFSVVPARLAALRSAIAALKADGTETAGD